MTTDSNDILEVGARIASHLTVRGMLGEGGMARVYEAHHDRLNTSVAVKVLSLKGERARLWGERLVREAHICARLEDARIPRIFDVSSLSDGRPYVVMEKVSGLTLEQYLQQGPVPLAAAVSLTRELLAALSVVHAAGIVHRDVKPGNIMLQQSGGVLKSVRLMDFGIAHVMDRSNPTPAAATMQSHILGTPGYMAPEQVDAEHVDGRADLYSAGVVLFEMLTGRPPFSHTDPIALVRMTLDRDVPDIRTAMPACPRELAYAVRMATARRRDSRFASAAQFARALDAVPAVARRPGPKVTPRRGYQGLLIAAALGGGLWFATQSVRAPAPQADLDTPSARPVAPEPPPAAASARPAPQLPKPESLAVDPALSPEVSKNSQIAAELSAEQPASARSAEAKAKADAARRRQRRAASGQAQDSRRQEPTPPSSQPPPSGRLVSDYLEELDRVLEEKPEKPARARSRKRDPLPENPY